MENIRPPIKPLAALERMALHIIKIAVLRFDLCGHVMLY
jgi:hypothetical protein